MIHTSWLKNRWYTIRRWNVDLFCLHQIGILQPRTKVLDLGGHKMKPSGKFNIGSYPFDKVCLNISSNKGTDILADACEIPFKNSTFDCVVLTEVLEHVKSPRDVLDEVHRVVKPNGKVIITVPFMYRVHADPYDYGRYTEHYWKELFQDLGFELVVCENHGGFWSVLLDPLRIAWAIFNKDTKRFYAGAVDYIIYKISVWAVLKDMVEDKSFQKFYSSFTTGYGFVLINRS